MFNRFAVLTMAFSLFAGAAAGQVLVNGGFESNLSGFEANGDNVGHTVAPWVMASGSANLVQVDGPLGYDYFSNGPESDASAPGAGIRQHYLDIAGTSGVFYQSFTASCAGDVSVGGSFSTRALNPATGSIELRLGVGTAGTLVGTPVSLTLPANNSKTWTPASFTVPLASGVTYSVVVSMDNHMNFDNGFVTYRRPCPECMSVKPADIHCNANGTFEITAQVTNLSANATQFVFIAPPPGATYTVSPNVVPLTLNAGGGQGSVTVTVSGAMSGELICLNYFLQDAEHRTCCFVSQCFTLPECSCIEIRQTALGCDPGPDAYAYSFTLTNLTGFPIQQLQVIPSSGTVTPLVIPVSIPANATSTPITLHLNNVRAGDQVCFIIQSFCCATKVCITIPDIQLNCD